MMKMKLRFMHFLHLAAGAAALPAMSLLGGAQIYPTRPITMIAPVAAGSSSDVVADRTAKPLGQPVIIENVSGADGTIGTGKAARAKPDGD
jgi:tripartite-type tricarboxylate transporter receptor subunit TctC